MAEIHPRTLGRGRSPSAVPSKGYRFRARARQLS